MDYLVKQQYIDPQTANLKRKDLHLSQSLPEATLRHIVGSHAGLNNSVSFNCMGTSEVVLDEQFTQFKHYLLTECVPSHRSELECLLYPFFCHVYLEMISSGHKNSAHRFMSKHQGLFQGKPVERCMVETLQIVFTIYDIYQKEEVRNFRESKFCVQISANVLEHLMRYLQSQDHTGLLYLLERFVDFNVVVVDEDSEREPPEKKMKETKETLHDLAAETVEFPVKSGNPPTHRSKICSPSRHYPATKRVWRI